MTREKNPIGFAGRQVALNTTLIRQARGMTKQALSDATAKAGRSIPPLGISRIEALARRVDADDLVVLAAALGVEPAVLLAPISISAEVAVRPAEASMTNQAAKERP